MLHIGPIANSDGPGASNSYASHDGFDSNWPDRDFNFTSNYAADEMQVANLTQRGMSTTSVSTRYQPGLFVTKSRAACNQSDRTEYFTEKRRERF